MRVFKVLIILMSYVLMSNSSLNFRSESIRVDIIYWSWAVNLFC